MLGKNKKLPFAAQSALAIQLSSLSAENGNASLAGSTHVSGPGSRTAKSIARQQKDSKTVFAKKQVTDWKIDDITRQEKDAQGRLVYKANSGVVDKLNAHTGTEGIKKVKRMDPKIAKHILNKMEGRDQINNTVLDALRDAAGKRRV